jgi:hypothetical protein
VGISKIIPLRFCEFKRGAMDTQVLIAAKHVCFHKVDYVINIYLLHSDLLVVEVEENAVGDKWKGQFSAKCM